MYKKALSIDDKYDASWFHLGKMLHLNLDFDESL